MSDLASLQVSRLVGLRLGYLGEWASFTWETLENEPCLSKHPFSRRSTLILNIKPLNINPISIRHLDTSCRFFIFNGVRIMDDQESPLARLFLICTSVKDFSVNFVMTSQTPIACLIWVICDIEYMTWVIPIDLEEGIEIIDTRKQYEPLDYIHTCA